MSFQPPKGTYDVVAGSTQTVGDPAVWRVLLAEWELWCARFGYPLVLTPIFESTDLFERGVGETTEVVNRQMYTFTDKGGRSITLRPEGTAGVVRAYLGSGGQGAWKGAYSGPMFRYERPQRGRYRQFWQLGVEYLDVEGPMADVEVVELGFRYLAAVGVPGLETRINSLGCRDCRPAYLVELRQFMRDREDDLSAESRELIDRNPLRILDSNRDGPRLVDAPSMSDRLCSECADHFEAVKSGLSAVGVPYMVDPRLVRGLDYYTRTAFEYIGTELDAAQDAVGGGGRYDGLAETIGGRPAPGVGLALGLERIVLSVGAFEGAGIDVYLVSEVGAAPALAAASRLRAAGLAVDFDTEGRSVKAQFRSASRSGAPVTIVLGEGEQVDVRAGEERTMMSLEEVPEQVRRGKR
jgi:histidyl-tRNA synthetase